MSHRPSTLISLVNARLDQTFSGWKLTLQWTNGRAHSIEFDKNRNYDSIVGWLTKFTNQIRQDQLRCAEELAKMERDYGNRKG